ncbi:MAG: VWA domain-containing protein, partial [Oscillospiraceae bacterium]|nr:VWA domain-containing protein [Oscillospiraceae bacterium]
MKTKLRLKLISAILVTAMTATLFPSMVLGADGPINQISTGRGGAGEGAAAETLYFNGNGGTAGPGDFAVAITKSITDTVNGVRLPENEFEITLEVVTYEEVTEASVPADALVVLVMDVSGSMNRNETYYVDGANRTRMWVAVNAAKKFINGYADVGSYTGVIRGLSIVAFGNSVKPLLGWTNVAGNASVGANALNAINTGSGQTPVSDLGAGTNVAGGLKYANNLLGAVPGALSDPSDPITNVHVILLSDGGPTGAATSAGGAANYARTTGTMTADYGSNDRTGGNATFNVRGEGVSVSNDSNDGYKNCVSYAIAEAASLKGRATYTPVVHSIGFTTQNFTTSQQEYWAYHRSNTDRMSVTAFLGAVSSFGNVHDASNEFTLDNAFKTIYGSIITDPWTVTDTMGANMAFAEDVSGLGYVTWDPAKNQFVWDLPAAYKAGKVSSVETVSDGKTETRYTFTFSYRVKLSNLSGYTAGDVVNTNSFTELNYNVTQNGVRGPEQKVQFISPKVFGFAADFGFVKKDSRGDTVEGAVFDVYVTDGG